MKVTLRTLKAGPEGVVQPGETVDVSHAEADGLLRGRFATPADAAAEKLHASIHAEASRAVKRP